MRTLRLLTLVWSLSLAIAPASAHEVQIQQDVGATLHIEPNDIPRANTPTQVWFALTQAGGQVIPLSACACELTLYDSQEQVLATPPLSPITVESYSNIPGAIVTFPTVGQYQLALAGRPQGEVEFASFTLRFEVVVASRAKSATAVSSGQSSDAATAAKANDELPATLKEDNVARVADEETPNPSISSGIWQSIGLWSGAVILLGVLWGLVRGRRSPGGKS